MKTIGIIGGMGPLATIDIFNKIVRNTQVEKDQDHIPILINNNPQIPDRTKSILSQGISPVDEIIKSGKKLEAIGADFLIIPCNTSHYYIQEIEEAFNIPLLNMIELTVKEVKKEKIKKVAVLGTEGTLRTKIYQDKLDEYKIEYVDIKEEDYPLLSYVIYDVVKAGNFSEDIKDFKKLLDSLMEEGVESLILGCTELPVLFEKYKLNYNFIDPTEILAREAIKYALE